MRKHLVRDFDVLYHFDLEGNVRQNPTLSGTQYNVFGIQLGVGVTVGVRRRTTHAHRLFFARLDKRLRREQKLAHLGSLGSIARVQWQKLEPDADGNWFRGEGDSAHRTMLAMSPTDASARGIQSSTVFGFSAPGLQTNRDQWCYAFGRQQVLHKMGTLIEQYSTDLDRWRRRAGEKSVDDFVTDDERRIKWSSRLKEVLARGIELQLREDAARVCLYRPFTRELVYFDEHLNHRRGAFAKSAPTAEQDNKNPHIWVKTGSEWPFFALAANVIVDLLPAGASQCFPFYIYDEDGSNRRENITDWALKTFREHYGDKRISKWDIFHYVYAVLHHPGYREKFADNLKRELPHIPFAADFRAFATAGEQLAELHLHYDDEKHIKAHPLKERWADPKRRDYRVEKMKLSKDKTTLIYNDSLTLEGIPADCFNYRLGNRSALEWVIDQYQVSTDKRSGIASDPNAWCDEHDDEQYILRLVKQVITVSLETLKLVRGLPKEFSDGREGAAAATPTPTDEAPPVAKTPGKSSGFKLRSESPSQPRLRKS